jgi:plastocyanin
MGRFFVNPRRSRGISSVSILLPVAAWFVMVSGTAWGGTIGGMVRYTGPKVEKKKLKVTIDNYICGKRKEDESLVLSPAKGIRNAVVSLLLPPGAREKATPSPMEVKMDQKQCVFVPHVLIVPVGGTVRFMSSDRLLHNILSTSKLNSRINRAQPKGRTIPVKFNKPEIIRIDCNLHSWMHAWVVVADHPFYAVTDDQGKFTLNNVPPGKYTIQVWQESLGVVTEEVTVTDKGIKSVTLEMGEK